MTPGLAVRNAVASDDSAVSAVPVLLREKLEGEKGDRGPRGELKDAESMGTKPKGDSLRPRYEGDASYDDDATVKGLAPAWAMDAFLAR